MFVALPYVNNVIAMDVSTGDVKFTIGNGDVDGADISTDAGTKLNRPSDVALDGYGNLLVADQENKRIAVFNASDGTPITSFHPQFTPRSVYVDPLGSVIVGGDKGLFMWVSGIDCPPLD